MFDIFAHCPSASETIAPIRNLMMSNVLITRYPLHIAVIHPPLREMCHTPSISKHACEKMHEFHKTERGKLEEIKTKISLQGREL